MTINDVEQQLALGPPEERGYVFRPLVLDGTVPTRTARIAPSSSVRDTAAHGFGVLGAAVLAGALLVGAFVAGRLSAPLEVGPAAAPAQVPLVQPAVVSDALRAAFYSGAERDRLWLVCNTDAALACVDAPVLQTNDTFGTDEWPFVQPVTIAAGNAIVAARVDPALSVQAYLVQADHPSAGGPLLVPVVIHPGDTFLDLGRLVPGRYLVVILTDPTLYVMPGQNVIGIVAR